MRSKAYGRPEARQKAAATESANVPDDAYIDGQPVARSL